MIKVLYLPLNYGSVVQQGVYDAFEQAGCKLKVFDYFAEMNALKQPKKVRVRLQALAREFKPHLMHMQIQHTNIIDGPTIASIKRNNPNVIVTNWTGDVRNYVPETFKRVAKFSDYNLISSVGQIDMFSSAIGKEAKYWQIGYNPKLYYPPKQYKNKYEYDAIFIANHNVKDKHVDAPLRAQVCKKLRQAFGPKFALHGDGWKRADRKLKPGPSLAQKDLARYYHRSLTSISINHYNDIDHYFSDRLLMCMACGRPTISYRFPGWESYFTDGCDLLIAYSADDMIEKIRYLKNNPEYASYIGQQGAEKVLAEHTYFSRINELLEMVGLKNEDT